MLADPTAEVHPMVVNGAAGLLITVEGRPSAVIGFTVSDDRIVEIDSIADPERLDRLQLSVPSE